MGQFKGCSSRCSCLGTFPLNITNILLLQLSVFLRVLLSLDHCLLQHRPQTIHLWDESRFVIPAFAFLAIHAAAIAMRVRDNLSSGLIADAEETGQGERLA
jgi:hypothetical protein